MNTFGFLRIPSLATAVLFLAACGGDGDGDGGDGGSSKPDAGGESTDHNDDISGDAQSVCDQLVTCVSVVTLDEGDSTRQAYGEGGSCWQAFSADECRAQCLMAISALNKANSLTDACNVCDVDDDCPGWRPHCHPTAHECHQCDTDDDCSKYDDRRCDPNTNLCVSCADSSHCGGSEPVCHFEDKVCVECVTSEDCANHPDRPTCDDVAFQCVP